MYRKFEISCKECGICCDYNPDDTHSLIKLMFSKGSPSIHDKIVIFCNKCGNKHEIGIAPHLDLTASQPNNAVDAKKSCPNWQPYDDDNAGFCSKIGVEIRTTD